MTYTREVVTVYDSKEFQDEILSRGDWRLVGWESVHSERHGKMKIIVFEKEIKKTIKRGEPSGNEHFDKFWDMYPKARRKSKIEALKAFNKVDPKEYEKLFESLAVHVKNDFFQSDARFVPYPSTWLNQKRWEDEVDPSELVPPKFYKAIKERSEKYFDSTTKYPTEELKQKWLEKLERGEPI